MRYYSQAWQDECVCYILNFKRDSYYLDIGSGGYDILNNSYYFELNLGWKGICVDSYDWAEGYKNRNCLFLNTDATKVDYKSIFVDKSFPARLDYLSVDVDENTLATLQVLPLDDYRFSVITIEHDAYRLGDTLRNEERVILEKYGYVRLFSDVLVPLGCGSGGDHPFEDWWIDPVAFNAEKIKPLFASNMYPDDIAAMLKKTPGVNYQA